MDPQDFEHVTMTNIKHTKDNETDNSNYNGTPNYFNW